MGLTWKKGRGKLGLLRPLLGGWVAESDSEMGPVRCTRLFEPVLGGAYVRLTARWEFAAPRKVDDARCEEPAPGRVYEEIALFGAGASGAVEYWSFTSDGKRSQGAVTDAADIHPEAIGFEARMPAGLARMVYWPVEGGGFRWAVESKSAKGWKRFVEHLYRPA